MNEPKKKKLTLEVSVINLRRPDVLTITKDRKLIFDGVLVEDLVLDSCSTTRTELGTECSARALSRNTYPSENAGFTAVIIRPKAIEWLQHSEGEFR